MAAKVLSEHKLELPENIFRKSNAKALRLLSLTVLVCSLAYTSIIFSPWFLLPLAWILAGTSICGLFVVGSECGTERFFNSKILDHLIGNIVFLPFILPFEAFRQNAKQARAHLDSRVEKTLKYLSTSRLWIFTSIGQWLTLNFAFSFKKRVFANVVIMQGVTVAALSVLVYKIGFWLVAKYWIIPLAVCHFWISTLMKINYSIGSSASKDTVILYKLPKWVEFMCHDFNYSVSSIRNLADMMVPTYNVRDACTAMRNELGKNVREMKFGWNIFTDLGSKLEEYADATQKAAANCPEVKAAAKEEPLIKRINWVTATFITITPILSIVGLFYVPQFKASTFWVALAFWFVGGVGITSGYHRLWSHRSYDARLPLRLLLLFMGSSAFEGSVFDWAKDHRAHHRYTDTENDPYNAKRGFFYSHMGWMYIKRAGETVKADISDLESDPILRFQHKFYVPFAVLSGFGVPIAICGYFFNDWVGGIVIAALCKSVALHQVTFCINSLAHVLGNATYQDEKTPRDSYITSLVTFGEGYHNFHHLFPYDYRNGLHLYDYDPGKWFICFFAFFGQAYNLRRFPSEVFEKCRLQMKQKEIDRMQAKLDKEKAKLFWGPKEEGLPGFTWEQVKAAKGKKNLIVVDGFVYDIPQSFVDNHPGGASILKVFLNKDATKAFRGAVYDHSPAARNILATHKVGRLVAADQKISEESDKATAKLAHFVPYPFQEIDLKED